MTSSPLAQDFVVVAERPSLDVIVDDPALVRLPSGALLATFTFRGMRGEAAHSNPQRFNLARSDDDGRSWQKLPALELCDGMPFLHDGRVYIIGNNLGRRDIVILCSDDDGATWSPTVALFEGHFWNAPTGVARTDRFLYRAFGSLAGDQERGGWLEGSSSVVAVGDLAGDLMSPASWRLSPPVEYPGTPAALSGEVYPDHWTDHWLEPNVVNVAGRVRVLQRVRIDGYATSGMCAVCDLTDDGASLQYQFTQFYPMPGAQNQFHIVYDEESRLFWTPVNLPADTQDTLGREDCLHEAGFKSRPGNERRFLFLQYSLDALNWFPAGLVAMWPKHRQSFHYVGPLIDGDALLLLSRTSRDAANQHDSDLVTFHRVPDFRRLALDLRGEL